MAHRTLIVAKLQRPDVLDGIASTFADSDGTDLPHLIGVQRRSLFAFHDLYFHLVEAPEDIQPDLYRARQHPLYHDINTRLQSFVSPYDPNWAEPKDAMARCFYTWTADGGVQR